MSILGIDHINFHAERHLLEDMKTFYCDVVGLQPGFRPNFQQFGYWLYADNVPLVHLYEAVGRDVRQSGAVSAFDHVAFRCSESQDVIARLERLGVPYKLVELPHSGQLQINVTDPAGHKVEFLVDAKKSS